MLKMKSLLRISLPIIIAFYLASCDTASKGTTSSNTNPTPTEKEEKVATLVNFIASDDVDAAQKRALKEKKVLFIDFYTSWCAPCKVMEQSVFKDVLVAEYMNENCICIRVNAEKGNGPNMKIAYAVDAYPTMLFYSSIGDEVARKVGSMGIEEFKKYMKASVWKAKNPIGTP